LNTNTLMYC